MDDAQTLPTLFRTDAEDSVPNQPPRRARHRPHIFGFCTLDPDLLTRLEAARAIGVNVMTLDKFYRERRGPKRLKIGSRVYYDRKKILEWIRSQEQKPEANDRPRRRKYA
jgi:predicted DNA-binding transcriptional regulator AlpA